MKLLTTLALALAPLRAYANGRLTRYARNSSYATSHPGRCDRNVFERQFYDLAKGLKPTSDKVTAHSYETMYGQFVYPLKFAAHTPRMLEIGLGCNMDYGPGASVQKNCSLNICRMAAPGMRRVPLCHVEKWSTASVPAGTTTFACCSEGSKLASSAS